MITKILSKLPFVCMRLCCVYAHTRAPAYSYVPQFRPFLDDVVSTVSGMLSFWLYLVQRLAGVRGSTKVVMLQDYPNFVLQSGQFTLGLCSPLSIK